ncbi:hypothetical protein KIN20_011691 [Parelaphostrongylus tenuis]|uniref:Uncharacterized protein n=1 Tax=Parelaphostrongylus tenuis TaxID=148309 RepID=A0AAD5M9U6_PARTN|nr:hypothetical protein KIN20_011691 [Parelaphostrongylus tenuis]
MAEQATLGQWLAWAPIKNEVRAQPPDRVDPPMLEKSLMILRTVDEINEGEGPGTTTNSTVD